ncbi:hypothetical protein LV779_21405 [Streptomyces thinghirensis]|nr:hypothetical protein [Streptomyces thinghirensis]
MTDTHTTPDTTQHRRGATELIAFLPWTDLVPTTPPAAYDPLRAARPPARITPLRRPSGLRLVTGHRRRPQAGCWPTSGCPPTAPATASPPPGAPRRRTRPGRIALLGVDDPEHRTQRRMVLPSSFPQTRHRPAPAIQGSWTNGSTR